MANADQSSELPGWVQTVMEAYSNWDVDKVVACMTDDVIREVKPLGERVQGTEAVREMLRGNEGFSSDVRVEPGQLRVVTDEVWALEWTMSGTNDRGPSNRGIPKTGRPFRIQGVSIGRVRDGKIAEERVYFDAMDLRTQLGLMPETPAAASP
jgi:steroid delta-isomerase-like uncharacterized protein